MTENFHRKRPLFLFSFSSASEAQIIAHPGNERSGGVYEIAGHIPTYTTRLAGGSHFRQKLYISRLKKQEK